jgi:hypothetical protein
MLMLSLATLQRRVQALKGAFDCAPSRCRCNGPIAIIQQGEPPPEICPSCGGVDPPVMEIVEEEIVRADES